MHTGGDLFAVPHLILQRENGLLTGCGWWGRGAMPVCMWVRGDGRKVRYI
jgi:hypothetical protein